MKTVTIIGFCLMALGHTCHGQNKNQLSIKTTFIGNREYVVSDDWGLIPLNSETGEDLNSIYNTRYGRPPYSLTEPEKEEKRLTVAKNKMQITVKISNNSQIEWQVLAFKLEVVDTFNIRQVDYSNGKWAYGTQQENPYIPLFEIDEDTAKYIDAPRSLVISSNKNPSDNNFIIQVQKAEKSKLDKLIFGYRIYVELSRNPTISNLPNDKVVLTADKIYYLCFLNE